MTRPTPELLARLLDAHAEALELFAAQWSRAPADVVQEAFIELARRPEAPRDAAAWLFRVVRNRAISEARSAGRRQRRESVASPVDLRLQSAGSTQMEPADAAEALGGLPEALRETVIARLWGGLTFEEIGELTGTSAATAFRRYEEALARLRARLGISCRQHDTTETD
jgi:RNA polymerase sigma-70 factor (ECF subfamily)